MAKKEHGKGRGRRPQRRHDRPRRLRSVRGDRAEDQPLFQELRTALRSKEPLDLLAVVSGLLEATDPRGDPLLADNEGRPTRDELVESFVGTPYAETTAALTVMRALVPDELMAARIGRELADRRHPLPVWLDALGHPRVEPQVWFMTHALGDGDDYLLGASFPAGLQLSALVYVDHNLSTVVKDAFVVAGPLDDLVDRLGGLIDRPDQSLGPIDPATARAVVQTAIEDGSHFYPPLASDTWPMCRPLVEWLLRMLPAGGTVPERPEWSEAETAALAADFFASPIGAPLNRPDEVELLDSVLWFGTGYGPGDPLRWSPVSVEILLTDWFPRKIVAPPSYLSKLPDVLRAFIRYCHGRRNIRAGLTKETVAAVDAYEPEYQRVIRSARLQGPAALLAGMLPLARDGGDEDDRDIAAIILEGLDQKVGGRFQLQNLDEELLPDERFEWAGIAEDIRPVVEKVLDACDRCADELFDVEHRTAMRRFLSRAAAADPAIFRRKASTMRAAAAVAWVIGRANDTIGSWSGGISVQDLLAWFGVKGSVSQRAEPLLRANGVDPHRLYGAMDLNVPDLLTGERRREVIVQRDWWLDKRAAGGGGTLLDTDRH